MNTAPSNAHGNMLDLIFSTLPERLSVIEEYPGVFDTDHTLLQFKVLTKVKQKPSMRKTVFSYKKGNYERMRQAVRAAHLCDVVRNCNSLDRAWEVWLNSVNAIVIDCVPRVVIKDYTTPPWIDSGVRHARNIKHTAWKKARVTNSSSAWGKFRVLRNNLQKLLRKKI